jgi:hypothetical protein
MAMRLSTLCTGRALLPKKIPGTHFCQRLCYTRFGAYSNYMQTFHFDIDLTLDWTIIFLKEVYRLLKVQNIPR